MIVEHDEDILKMVEVKESLISQTTIVHNTAFVIRYIFTTSSTTAMFVVVVVRNF